MITSNIRVPCWSHSKSINELLDKYDALVTIYKSLTTNFCAMTDLANRARCFYGTDTTAKEVTDFFEPFRKFCEAMNPTDSEKQEFIDQLRKQHRTSERSRRI